MFVRFTVSILVIILAMGCNPTSFGGSDETKKRAPAEEPDAEPESVEEKEEESPTDSVSVKEEPPKCTEKDVGIDIIFALDVTSSMRDSLGIISNNIVNLTKQLEKEYSSDVDINYGVVPFHDDVVTRSSGKFMWEDKKSFRSQIEQMNVSSFNGRDPPEAGLLAIRTAYDALVNEGEGDLKYIVYVSDQVGHNGDSLPRDCSLEKTVNHWGVDDIRILVSVPERGFGTIVGLPGFDNCMPDVSIGSRPKVKDQYERLFEKIQGNDKDFKFQFLDFPLSSEVVSLEIPEAITCE